MKFDTTIATLKSATYFAGKDQNGSFFVMKKNYKCQIYPVLPCPNGVTAEMLGRAMSMMEQMSTDVAMQVIAKARA